MTFLLMCCFWILLGLSVFSVQAQPGSDFVGSQSCQSCHQSEFHAWQTSHHAKAMLSANAENRDSVLGNFRDQSFEKSDETLLFTRHKERYIVKVTDRQKQISKAYPVAYTFGYHPLQQYVLEMEKGQFQVLDVAWDSRSKQEGGQRWFQLLPDLDTGKNSRWHWSRHVYNWNSRCADCHSTGLTQSYDTETQRHKTEFAEVNVACEACHGAASEHEKKMRSGKTVLKSTELKGDVGLSTNFTGKPQFQFQPGKSTAEVVPDIKKTTNVSSEINACGGCHSRRQRIGPINPASDYHDQYLLSLLVDPLYYEDGQIQDEVFVLGSFLQSKMHQAGVTCSHCHDPHSGQVVTTGNGLCAQCHQPEVFDTPTHHHHPSASEGAQCVNCHMPATTYMEVDGRRDHGMRIPKPNLEDSDAPDTCKGCHEAMSLSDIQTQWQAWWGVLNQDEYVVNSRRARQRDGLGLRQSTEYIQNVGKPAIRRATLLTLAAQIPSKLTLDTLMTQLQSEDPLLRRAAVEASGFTPLEMRWDLLKERIDDHSASVRYAVARQLAAVRPHLQGEDQKRVAALLKEFDIMSAWSAGLPAGQGSLAEVLLAQGDVAGAEKRYHNALDIEPDYTPALLNLADMVRASQNPQQDWADLERDYLERALAASPDDAAVQHSMGLYWVRQSKMPQALPYLKKATSLPDSSARYFYVYAVALESVQKAAAAIKVLKQADARWPNQYDVLISLVMYLEQLGREAESWEYLSRLSAIAPNDPEVKRRIQALKANPSP